MIKAIIFDCFGVVKRDGLLNAYESLGGDVAADKQFIEDTINMVNRGYAPSSVPYFAEQLGVSEELWWQTMHEANTTDFGLLEYVAELRESYKTAMLSNVGRNGLARHFEPGLLDKYFDVAVGSGDLGYAKPEPQAYQTVADLLGTRFDECVFIDDRQEYIDGALAAGMKGLLYEGLDKLKNDLKAVL